jgi:hypothetical protein
MPDWHGTTGRDDLVGGPIPIYHEKSLECTHRDRDVCALCAELTPAETAAIRKYLALLSKRNAT